MSKNIFNEVLWQSLTGEQLDKGAGDEGGGSVLNTG
jgi:hypothetical protein